MASISRRPLPEVLEGVSSFAKRAGFRKFGTRFRLATEDGHGLVLLGEDGTPDPDGYRRSNWWLHVCYRPWADLYQQVWNREPVNEPMKFDPDRHAVVTFAPHLRRLLPGRPSATGFHPEDPDDVAAFVRYLDGWFTDVAVPIAIEWLENPRPLLDQLQMKAGPSNRHPDTQISLAQNRTQLETLLAAEIGDHDLARFGFSSVVRMAASNSEWSRWVAPLADVLARNGVEVHS